MDKEALRKWISDKLETASSLKDEAEKARKASGYTDIDALEQSAYNSGVEDVLVELLEFLK